MFKISLNAIEEPYENIKVEFSSKPRTVMRDAYSDMYYLCLDGLFLKDETLYMKGMLNFVFLLVNWKRKILKTPIGQYAFLPFDFSDEYIAGFHLLRKAEGILEVTYGASREFRGPSYSPVQIDMITPQGEELIILFDYWQMSEAELMAIIDEGLFDILNGLKDQ
jgi:hypothetical protein